MIFRKAQHTTEILWKNTLEQKEHRANFKFKIMGWMSVKDFQRMLCSNTAFSYM